MRTVRRLMAAPALAWLEPEEFAPGPQGEVGRGAARLRHAHRRDHLSPGRHLQDGQRSGGRRRRSAARARHRWPARRRRLDHADADLRQHQRALDHDRREVRAHGAGGGGRRQRSLLSPLPCGEGPARCVKPGEGISILRTNPLGFANFSAQPPSPFRERDGTGNLAELFRAPQLAPHEPRIRQGTGRRGGLRGSPRPADFGAPNLVTPEGLAQIEDDARAPAGGARQGASRGRPRRARAMRRAICATGRRAARPRS